MIEDCAQAPYAKYKNKFAGTLGDIGVYSLNYHKHIHTGEGGVLVTNDDNLAERMRLIRNHAEAVVEDKGTDNIVNMVGQNYRLTELQAAIGREQLKKLKKLVEERVINCDYLGRELSKINGIRSPKIRDGATHTYYVQPMLYDENKMGVKRDKFIEAVKAELPATELREGEGPQLSGGYEKPLYLQPLYQKRIAFGANGYPFNLVADRNISYEKGICPVAERMHERELFLHEFMRPPVTKDDLDDVVKAFQKVYKYRNEII